MKNKILWSLTTFAAVLGVLFLMFFIVIPKLTYEEITPVYSQNFKSTLEVKSVPKSEAQKASIVGQVKTNKGRAVPALIRLYNAQRTPRKLDVAAQSYTDIDGHFELNVPPGDYQILIYKGPEYEYFLQPLSVNAEQSLALDISLYELLNMSELGWFAGDPHQHSAYVDGADSIPDLLISNAAVGLHYSVQTDHNEVGQNKVAREFLQSIKLQSSEEHQYLSVGGDEISTTIGHMIAWEPKDEHGDHIHIDHSSPHAHEHMDLKKQALDRIISDLDQYAQFSQINHPGGGTRAYEAFGEKRGDSFMDVDFDWVKNQDRILAFDATETWNGGSGFLRTMYYFGSEEIQPFEAYERTFHEWYRLLNTGVRFPSLGSSDTHDASAAGDRARFTELVEGIKGLFGGFLPYMPAKLVYTLTGSVEAGLMYPHIDYIEYALEEIALLPGSPRTYIYTGGELSTQALTENIDHSFISSGPLLFTKVAGAIPGETAKTTGEDKVHIHAVSHKPLHKLMIIADGELIHEESIADALEYEETLNLDLSGKKWLIVYVEGNNNYAHAYTNPTYLN